MTSFRQSYEPCRGCARHVRASDAACPFCGASSAPPPHLRRSPRVSRGYWLAFGSALTATGCTHGIAVSSPDGAADEGDAAFIDAPETTPDAMASPPSDAKAYPSPDAMAFPPSDAGVPPDGDAVDPADGGPDAAPDTGTTYACGKSGTFDCEGQPCDRATSFCAGLPPELGCLPYASLVTTYAPWYDASACEPCPTYDCLAAIPKASDCYVGQDDAGGLTLSCGGCYGSPPARLERLPPIRRARVAARHHAGPRRGEGRRSPSPGATRGKGRLLEHGMRRAM